MSPASSVVVLGFIPLLDCAPLVAAAEKGFAADEGIDLMLVRETSWANIRDRVVVGHFDAAHMLGPMAIASSLGIGHLQIPMAAPVSLGLGGNAITLSTSLWEQLSHLTPSTADPAALGLALHSIVTRRATDGRTPLTFAMVYPFSCHNYELRYWLAAADIDPDHDVRLVVLPPPLLVDALREGQIDGFCVGEPWNSLAVSVGVGCIAMPTTAVWRLSPEKVLGCRLEWAERFPDRTAALIRAVYRGAQWCEQSNNHAELSRLLSQPKYVGAPADLLLQGLRGRFQHVPGGEVRAHDDCYVLTRQAATFPWVSHACWFYSQMIRWGQADYSTAQFDLARRTYRPDLYRNALAPLGVNIPLADSKIEGAAASATLLPSSGGTLPYGPDGFFDDRRFDPAELERYIAQTSRPRITR